jgi:bifunctional non-homologous end joining protein LigD
MRPYRCALTHTDGAGELTPVPVLSTRAREGAPVSMPHWKEVRKGSEPKRFALRTVPPLLKKTKSWADY